MNEFWDLVSRGKITAEDMQEFLDQNARKTIDIEYSSYAFNTDISSVCDTLIVTAKLHNREIPPSIIY